MILTGRASIGAATGSAFGATVNGARVQTCGGLKISYRFPGGPSTDGDVAETNIVFILALVPSLAQGTARTTADVGKQFAKVLDEKSARYGRPAARQASTGGAGV